MKDSKDYSPKIAKLFRALKRTHDVPEPPTYADPVEAVVEGLVIEFLDRTAAPKALKRMKHHFVDLNDIRVCRNEEILEVFRNASPAAEASAAAITRTLNTLFEKNDRVTLEPLIHEGKRQARKELEELNGITPFAVSYCFLTALGGHAIPLNAAMLTYLREHGLVHPTADEHDVAGFLERQIAAADAFAFYSMLKAEAETGPAQPAATSKTETQKKTTVKKKTAAKKKTAPKKSVKKTAAKKPVTKKTVKKKTKKK